MFYSIVKGCGKELVFGERPEDLADTKTISARVWEKHQTYLARLENFPLEKAEYYQNLKESTGVKSVRGLSEITGEDWSYIAKILRTLELPLPIQTYLSEHKEPSIVKYFNLRRLLELIQPEDERRQFNRFREMLDEATTT